MELLSQGMKRLICALLAALVLLTAAPAAMASGEPADPGSVSEETAAADMEDPLYLRYNGGVSPAARIPSSFRDVTPRALKPSESLRKGVDVSAYQLNNIDWNKVADSGVEFAIVRVGYRTINSGELMTDSCYAKNLAGASAAGLQVGAYYFSQATTVEEAREEAREAVRLVKGYDIDLPIVFDLEEVDAGTYPNRRMKLAEMDYQLKTDMCVAFCQEVEQAGYESMVYSNPYMLNNHVDRSKLGRLWLAHWSFASDYAGEYEYWQFGEGSVDGISTSVDLDYWFDPSGKLAPPLEEPTKPSPSPSPSPSPTPGGETAPQPETQASPFTDVKKSEWYYEEVLKAYEKKLVNGVGNGLFAPEDNASRGAVVTMLYRMAGSPVPESKAGFTDLTEDYYRDAVNWAASKGIVTGETAELFVPNGSITREQLAAMLYRMSGSPAVSGNLSSYSDGDSVSEYARSAMIWAVKAGVLNGDAVGTLRPGDTATRAEVCAMLVRYLSRG